MDWDAFFTVHSNLPREGPGLPQDVHWALSHVPGTPARVLDAGCGPGADTVTLAEALPQAQILSVDKHVPFVAQTLARVQMYGPRVEVRATDMMAEGGPFDLIWCAGAIYFVGVTEALIGWRDALTDGGHVAFTQGVLPKGAGAGAAQFWKDEPDVTDEAGIAAQVQAAGYEIVATKLIQGPAWEAYYTPMEARIAQLRAYDPTPEVEAACAMNMAEIVAWRGAQDEVAYLGVVARPV